MTAEVSFGEYLDLSYEITDVFVDFDVCVCVLVQPKQ